MEDKFPFSEEFQLAVLKLMTQDEAFLIRAIKYLKPNYFANQYLEYFFNIMRRYYYDHSDCPDLTYLDNEIKKLNPDERKKYENYYVRIHKTSIKSKEYILKSLIGFVRRNMFVEMYDEVANIYMRHAEDAYGFTSERIDDLNNVSFEEDIYIAFKDLESVLKESTEESQFALKLGIPKIDEALSGGVYRGDLCVILGDTNVGKSVVLLNILFLSIEQGKKVLFLNLEGRRGQPLLRLAARATGIPYNRIMTQTFLSDKEKEYYQKTINRLKMPELFQIRNLHDKRLSKDLTVNVEDVYALCKDIKKSFDFDVLIVDYGDRLDTRKKCGNRTEAQRVVYEGLDNMAKKFEVPVITASQVTRPDSDNRAEGWLRMRDVAEAYAKVRVAAVVLSINRSDREKVEGRLRILLDKSRDGETNIRVGCYSDYSKMTPYSVELGFFDSDGAENESDE